MTVQTPIRSSTTTGPRVRLPRFARGGTRTRTARPVTPPKPIRPGEADEVVSVLSSVFMMIGLVAIWFVLQSLLLGSISQARAQQVLYDDFRAQVAAGTAPLGPGAEPGAPVALLEIPALGLDQVVVEGTASGDLLVGPGHRRDTVLPGQAGISSIYGRKAMYGGPFARLTDLRKGDDVIVTTGQGRVVHRVLGVRRAGEPLPAPPGAGVARLTLVSGESDSALSQLRSGSVVYVDAESTKGLATAPLTGSPLPSSERAMATDVAAMPMLALMLGLLVALAFAISAARRRLRGSLIWVIATPVALALAWLTTEQVVRLVPNLL